MSEQQPLEVTPPVGSRPVLSTVVDGDEVRALVARTEEGIRTLLGELEKAQGEADAAEQRLVDHPSALRLKDLPPPIAVTADAPLRRPSSMPVQALRTVVDRRPPASVPSTTSPRSGVRAGRRRRRRRLSTEPGADHPTTAATTASTGPGRTKPTSRTARARPRLASRMMTGWMWKAGLALVVAALLVLKLG